MWVAPNGILRARSLVKAWEAHSRGAGEVEEEDADEGADGDEAEALGEDSPPPISVPEDEQSHNTEVLVQRGTVLGQVEDARDKATPAKKKKGLRRGQPLTPEFLENVPGQCATKGCTFPDFHDGACLHMMELGRGVRRGQGRSNLNPTAVAFQPAEVIEIPDEPEETAPRRPTVGSRLRSQLGSTSSGSNQGSGGSWDHLCHEAEAEEESELDTREAVVTSTPPLKDRLIERNFASLLAQVSNEANRQGFEAMKGLGAVSLDDQVVSLDDQAESH